MSLLDTLNEELETIQANEQLQNLTEVDKNYLEARKILVVNKLNYLKDSTNLKFAIGDRVRLVHNWSIRENTPYEQQKHFMHPLNCATVKDYRLYYDYDNEKVIFLSYLIEFDYETWKDGPKAPECQVLSHHLYEFSEKHIQIINC